MPLIAAVGEVDRRDSRGADERAAQWREINKENDVCSQCSCAAVKILRTD